MTILGLSTAVSGSAGYLPGWTGIGTRPALQPWILHPTLIASALATPTKGAAPFTTHLLGSALGGVSPYSFNWSFGDGGGGKTASPYHSYSKAGSYYAKLTVKDSRSHIAQATVLVQVTAKVPGVAATLKAGSVVARPPGSFWSIDAQTNCARCIATNPVIGAYLNSTPFVWVRYGAGVDTCNASTNVAYSDAGVASAGCAFNISALKAWCVSAAPHCHAVLALPGENNNSAEDAAIARYIVHTVGFQPDYWAIGNEPTQWTHYGIPWSKWRTTDASHPTSLAYAFDVKAAMTAVTAVDPAAKFIGIEAACYCNSQWFTDLAKINGGRISAYAYHSYPSVGSTSVTLAQFYSPLSTTANLSGSYAKVRSAVVAGCAACGSKPIFVNEYNAGPGWAPSNLAGSYANAVFLAASTAQALLANVSQLTWFNLQTGAAGSYGYALLNVSGAPGPAGILFRSVFTHLPIAQVLRTSVASAVPGVFAAVAKNASAEALLVANTNLTQAVALVLGTAFPTSVRGTTYAWSPPKSAPTVSSGNVSFAYSIPAQGILLITVPLSSTGVPLASLVPIPASASGSHGSAEAWTIGSAVVPSVSLLAILALLLVAAAARLPSRFGAL